MPHKQLNVELLNAGLGVIWLVFFLSQLHIFVTLMTNIVVDYWMK
jgi:hypothetical protein